MNQRILIGLLSSTLLAACTSVPMQQVQHTRDALGQAQQAIATAAADQQVQAYTAAGLSQAQDSLQAAQMAWTQDHDQARAGHLAHMAQRYAEIAQAEAAKQAAAAQFQQLMAQRAVPLQHQPATLMEQLSELKPKQTAQGIMLTLGQVLFAFGSTHLQPAAQAPLDKLATYLRDHPQIHVKIVGYTDSVGPAAYNQHLSKRRAQSVADAMTQRGIDRSRMMVSGGGESNPVASNATKQGRQLNRRVEFTLLNQVGQP